MNPTQTAAIGKIPAVTGAFWALKILATTLGETGGDALSMSMQLGYLRSSGIFGLLFILTVLMQVRLTRFHPAVYWITIVATTTVGTTLADFADRSLGIGYAGGSAVLTLLLLLSFWLWHRSLGTVALASVSTSKAEVFYWITILFSQTLGTALGDWLADTAGLGYLGAAVGFGLLIATITVLYLVTSWSRTVLFWAAFVLTRPLGAVVGDYLDKPITDGGLALSRYGASAVLLAAMILVLAISTTRRRT